MPEWFSLVTFGTTGEVLAQHDKGDMVAVSGRLTKSAWTGPGRRGARGFLGVRRWDRERSHGAAGETEGRPRDVHGGVPFDDELGF